MVEADRVNELARLERVEWQRQTVAGVARIALHAWWCDGGAMAGVVGVRESACASSRGFSALLVRPAVVASGGSRRLEAPSFQAYAWPTLIFIPGNFASLGRPNYRAGTQRRHHLARPSFVVPPATGPP